MPWLSCWCLRGACRAMRFARSILCAAFFLLFGVGGLVFSFMLLFPFPKPVARRALKGAFRFFVWLGRVTRLFRVDVAPADRQILSALRGSVVVANHLTLIDAVILLAVVGDSVCVTKKAVSRNPFMRAVARNVLIVNERPLGVLNCAQRYLADGVNVIVFPEGTRTPASAPVRVFRRGAAHMALRSGAPVEAISISCDPLVLGKRQPWWNVGARTIVYNVRYRGRIDLPHSTNRQKGRAVRTQAAALTREMHERIFGA